METRSVIRTSLCELLGIDHPIVQAGMGPFAPARLAAAVSNAGGLGSIGTFGLDPINLVRPADDLDRQFASIRDLTDRPFAVNFVVPYFEESADERMALFERALGIEPKLVSSALLCQNSCASICPVPGDRGAVRSATQNDTE